MVLNDSKLSDSARIDKKDFFGFKRKFKKNMVSNDLKFKGLAHTLGFSLTNNK